MINIRIETDVFVRRCPAGRKKATPVSTVTSNTQKEGITS
jgi:hypothetical protein